MLKIIFCTYPDEVSAKNIAMQLVKKQLAACVNIVPKVMSIFRWENQIEEAKEYLLLIKILEENYSETEKFIKSQHPYKVPEIIAISASHVEKDYLAWMSSISLR